MNHEVRFLQQNDRLYCTGHFASLIKEAFYPGQTFIKTFLMAIKRKILLDSTVPSNAGESPRLSGP